MSSRSVCRVGQDSSGGLIIGNLAPTVFVNNRPIAVGPGAAITPYGDNCRANPTTLQASSTVFAEGQGVVRSGDLDLCGTPCTSNSNVLAG